jgi:ferredoxin
MLQRFVALLDDAADRLWTSRLSPLHQSGTLAILSFGVLVVTGVYLFLFYSVDGPYESVARIDTELPGGSWIRSLHTYAADLAMVSMALHAVKMLAAGRTSRARTRAWLTGVVLVGVVLLCGWTGQVMAWDLQGQVVAVELTRILDLLPVFSMPMSRAFDGLAPVPGSFFFMNLFLHVCLPLGIALVLWMHVSRIARPALAPPKPVMWTTLGTLAVLSAVLPVRLATPADLLVIPKDVPVDLLFNFWLPLAWSTTPALHAAAWAVSAALFAAVPWMRRGVARQPSWVDSDHCTGCTTCYKDCPFDAITMVARPDPGRRSEFYALVNPDRCVSCGICAGSCAPMIVGPPEHTGRKQLERTPEFLEDAAPGSVVLYACRQNLVASDPRLASLPGVRVRSIECVGNLHTSVIDFTLRGGVAGVFVLGCPSRSAPCREGPKWLHERVYNDREAELPARVDKRRVAIAALSRGEWAQIEEEVAAFRVRLHEIGAASGTTDIDLLKPDHVECEPPTEERGRA